MGGPLRHGLWCLALALAALSAPAAAATDTAADPALAERALFERAGCWVDEGFEEPDRVLAQIDNALAPDDLPPALWQRVLERTRGVVAARAGRSELAHQSASRLAQLADAGDTQARGDEHLVLAMDDDQHWRSDAAEQHARRADEVYATACTRQPLAGCEARAWWRALRLLASRAEAQGHLVEARSLQQRALDAAMLAGDGLMHAWTLSSLAVISHGLGEADLARRQLAQAERIAQREPGPAALVRVRINEARLADGRGEIRASRRALEDAQRLARGLKSPRLDALILGNLSDVWLQTGSPREALEAVNRALPVVRHFGDLRSEPQLLHNGGLARLALGQVRLARVDLDAALALWTRAGAKGQLRAALRQYADALAAAGDPRAALEMYHRETQLRLAMEQANREALLQELRQRHRSEADQRDLEQLARDNQLKAAQLVNQSLMQRIWGLGGVLLLTALAVLGLLVKRTRDANLLLRRSEALLQVQSQRDALTGLANRRHFREVLATTPSSTGDFEGGLVLLDVDHFKRINDKHGHFVGDAVLTEVARRLAAAARSADLACRWGGEEFLVYSPGLQGDGVESLAWRLLRAVGDTPVRLPDGRDLAVTVSVGYGGFPLPLLQVGLGWERAVNLVDMALYTAKSQGRDTAVGLLSACAATAPELTALEQGFEGARKDGRIGVRVQHRS